jgi:hypothetical protein
MTKVTIISDPASGVTAAKVHHWGVTGVGISEQTLPDVFNITIGEELALGRAFQDLGRKLEKRGYKKVHQIERARIKKEKKAEKLTVKHGRVGELITTVEQFEALPLGTKVVLSATSKGGKFFDGYTAFKKDLYGTGGGEFYTEDDGYAWNAHMVISGYYGDFTIVSIP